MCQAQVPGKVQGLSYRASFAASRHPLGALHRHQDVGQSVDWLPCRKLRVRTRHTSRCRAVVQEQEQQKTAAADSEQPAKNVPGQYGISLKQLQKLAELQQGDLWKTDSFDSPRQLAQCLATSLERGLTSDTADLEARAKAFGTNRLPEKERVGASLAVRHAEIRALTRSLGAVSESQCLTYGWCLMLSITRRLGY